MSNPAIVPDLQEQPQPRNGRPPGSRSGYLISLEKQAAQQAALKYALIADPLLRTTEAAQLLGLSYASIRRLIVSGQLKTSRTCMKNGHHRIRLSELRRHVAAMAAVNHV